MANLILPASGDFATDGVVFDVGCPDGGGTAIQGRSNGTDQYHSPGTGVSGTSDSGGIGVYGEGTGFDESGRTPATAVAGYSPDGGFGVYGASETGIGVYGESNSRQPGVAGLSGKYGDGVYGESTDQGNGVHGKSPSGAGVYGEDISQDAGSFGVYGTSNNGWGVRGESGGYAGVYGEGSGAAYGVWGAGTIASGKSASGVLGTTAGSTTWTPAGVEGHAAQGPGVFAQTSQGEFGLIAVSSTILAAGDFKVRNSGHMKGAAAFGGDVSVSGGLYVEGPLKVFGDPKSAVVRLSDGSHRLLYCMESPESWFEDFGRGRLVRGQGKVTLDRTFAAVVRTDDYHVFLSPEGESGGIYVSRRTRTGFEVREHAGGRSTLRFSYRIVARRKGVTAPRFKKEAGHPVGLRRAKAVSSPKAAALPKRLTHPILPKMLATVQKRGKQA